MTLAEEPKAGLAEERQKPIRATYEDDPYTWALEQARLLRSGQLDRIDVANLADEIEALVHYLADKLRSDLTRLLQHLVKWDYQPDHRSRSWALSIQEHRRRVARHLRKGPGLRAILGELVEEAYADGRRHALDETHLPIAAVPERSPYGWDEIMTRSIEWPQQSPEVR